MRKFTIIFCLWILAGPIKAQIITDRPDQTESASVINKAAFQLESGLLASFARDKREFVTPTSLFRLGLGKGFELRLVNEMVTVRESSSLQVQGVNDLQLGTKFRLFNSGGPTEGAVLAHLILPTGSHGLTLDQMGISTKLSLSHQLSDRVGLGYNLGLDYFDSETQDLTYALALGVSLTDKLSVFIEPYGAIVNIEEMELNLDMGFTYLLRLNLQADFSFGSGITDEFNFISTGISWLIE